MYLGHTSPRWMLVILSGDLAVPACRGPWGLLTTMVNNIEGSASREKVLGTVRAVIDHARDRDGHLTILDFSSSLIGPWTNVSESGSLDLRQWMNLNRWVQPAHGSAQVPGMEWHPSEILAHHAHQASSYQTCCSSADTIKGIRYA